MRVSVVAVSLLFALTACRKTGVKAKGCAADADCGDPGSAYRCEPQTGECYCRTNDACQPREFCNPAGFCQDRSGCEKNADCLDVSLFCDTTTGTCLGKGRCSFDLQCALGQICDTAKATCVPGCRSSGDCPGTSCRCGDVPCVCTGSTSAEVAKCAKGECDPNFCASDSFCKFGETCGARADAGMARNACYSDYDNDRRPYCDNCSFGGGTSVCGTGANYCLIDTAHPGNYYCGTDCAEGQSCPRGYACSDVIVVLQQQACTKTSGCQINPALPCVRDEECKRGGFCAIQPGQTSGHCAGRCGIDEGDSTGFCSCQVDEDCAQQSCSAGECSISRKKCVGDQDCRKVRCVDFQGGGGCLIGQNCAPSNGLSCLEVK